MPLYLKDKLVSGTGAPGKSAYQTAVEAGYAGTETAFNQALMDVPGHIANNENPHGVTAKQAGAIASSEKGAANGVATLGADALLAAAQRPKAGGLYRDDGKTTLEASLEAIDTLLANKENSFSVLPINKGGTGADNIKTARANLGIDKNISCPAGGSITLTLPQGDVFLIGTSDNIRSSGLILVYTKSFSAQNNVGRVVQLDTPGNWSYSLSGGVLTLSETDGRYPADFSVVTLCCGTYSEVYS